MIKVLTVEDNVFIITYILWRHIHREKITVNSIHRTIKRVGG
jgi:hypothetical protein